ncbi:paraquat-inducible protein A [Albirhodobacter sp. R86504]|jgi:paraquat-inducible protein A|uniref:paraquat-inducible protein A n=1 Tax=Albirhodobacter sp. R86504 TaxID=3093848 RepID=UPI00366B2CB0
MKSGASVLTASRAGVVGCKHCGRVLPRETEICTRCGSVIEPPSTASLQKVWAWFAAGLVMYVPANVLPMLVTSTLNGTQASTILGGVIELMLHGSWGVASIVFIASIMIPVAKFMAIAYLALSVGTERRAGGHRHLVLYEIVEFIGRWSMIDVFVVAILSALVQLGFVASIHPGPAAASFALSVAFTMLSAQSFDPRLIWRGPEDRETQ